MKLLRIDPIKCSGTVSIDCIELVKRSYAAAVIANAELLTFDFMPRIIGTMGDPTTAEGIDCVVTADPGCRFFTRLGLYYEWNRYDGTLMVESDKHRVVFAVGQNTVARDGETVPLGYTFSLRDGLPVFHVRGLCELFEFKLHVSAGGVFEIVSVSDELYEALQNRVPYRYEFAAAGLDDDFTAAGCRIRTENGTLNVVTTDSDPQIFLPTLNIPASQYTKLVIGVIPDASVMTGKNLEVYFVNGVNENWTAGKCLRHSFDSASLGSGNVYEITFDLTGCAAWAGNIAKIRIDPIGGNVPKPIRIDYIRLM